MQPQMLEHRSGAAHGEDEWTGTDAVAHEDPAAYIKMLLGWSAGKNLPKNWGPVDVYWVLLDDVVVAHCDIRHPLNQKLNLFGYHVGRFGHDHGGRRATIGNHRSGIHRTLAGRAATID